MQIPVIPECPLSAILKNAKNSGLGWPPPFVCLLFSLDFFGGQSRKTEIINPRPTMHFGILFINIALHYNKIFLCVVSDCD